MLNQIVMLRSQVHSSCDVLCRAAVQGVIDELQSAMDILQDKVSTVVFFEQTKSTTVMNYTGCVAVLKSSKYYFIILLDQTAAICL